jgi:hypothetical protein
MFDFKRISIVFINVHVRVMTLLFHDASFFKIKLPFFEYNIYLKGIMESKVKASVDGAKIGLGLWEGRREIELNRNK